MHKKILTTAAASLALIAATATPASAGFNLDHIKRNAENPRDCVLWTQSIGFNYLKYGGEPEPGDGSSWLNLPFGGGATPEQRAEAEQAWEALPMFVWDDGSTYGWVRVSNEKICDRIDLDDIDRYKKNRMRLFR